MLSGSHVGADRRKAFQMVPGHRLEQQAHRFIYSPSVYLLSVYSDGGDYSRGWGSALSKTGKPRSVYIVVGRELAIQFGWGRDGEH